MADEFPKQGRETGQRHRWLFPGRVAQAAFNSYDIIYIDGSHESFDTLEDLVLSSRLLKENGLMIMDDYQHYADRLLFDRPKFAMDAFYATFREQFDVIHYGWQVMLKKKAR